MTLATDTEIADAIARASALPDLSDRRAWPTPSAWIETAPRPGVIYRGHLIFSRNYVGDVNVLALDFDGLNNSPLFATDARSYVNEKARANGTIYVFLGRYRRFTTGGYQFVGTLSAQPIAALIERTS